MKKNDDKTTEAATQDMVKPVNIPGICPVTEKTCIATMNNEVLKSTCVCTIPGGI